MKFYKSDDDDDINTIVDQTHRLIIHHPVANGQSWTVLPKPKKRLEETFI